MGISTRRWVFGFVAALMVAGPDALSASEEMKISNVEVRSDGGLTQIVLRGAEDPIYTAFMRDNPPRLIIDFPDVVFEGVETPIQVGDGIVEDITLGAFGDPRVAATMARVSVGLVGASEYEVIPNGKELIVELRSPAGAAARASQPAQASGSATAATEPPAQTSTPMTSPSPAATSPAAEAAPASPVEPMPAATPEPEAKPEPAAAVEPKASPVPAASAASVDRITKVVQHDGMIELVADGPIDNVDSFALENPDRIVVDLWGMRNGVWPSRFTTDGGPVGGVRIGEHADKVRVVLDLTGPVASHTVEPTATGAMIHLELSGAMADDADGSADMPPAAPDEESAAVSDEASESWPEAADTEDDPQSWSGDGAAAADGSEDAGGALDSDGGFVRPNVALESTDSVAISPDGADVESVHFESLPEFDRLVVTLTDRVEAKLIQPDPVTVIVDMPGARITNAEERRVQTLEFGGPVEVFSAFSTPEVAGDQVRLVLRRHGAARPRIGWADNQLRLEIPRDGGSAYVPPAPDSMGQLTQEEAQANLPPAPGGESMDGSAESQLPAAPAVPAAGTTPGAAAVPAAFAPEDGGFSGPLNPASIDILEEGGFDREKSYVGRRVSLDFQDADIGNILRLIAEVSDLNVIAGEEVSGKVTIRLVEVPWDQALDIILLTKGLGFVRIGNILRIAPIDVLQREESARLQERRAKEKLEDLVVKLQPVNYASVTEVSGLVKRLLSGRGTVNVDKRTSTLIIKDIPSVIHEATALVKAIDTQTPQVLIEAKIVEASLDFSRSLGTRWAVGYLPDPNNQWGGQDFHLGDSSNVVPGFGSGSQANNFLVGLPVASSLGTLTMGLLGLNDRLQLDLQLQAAESNSKGKVISSPRVVTLDNRQAKIQQGVAIRFDASDGDSVSTSFVDAVLELAVTPHITADRSIIMDIKVSRNAPQLNGTGDDVVGIAKNETQTEALVRDGQTMVLGGIYTVDTGGGSSRVPFLADIPVIGTAFRNTTQQDVRRELLIFVTPRVVEGLPAAL